MVPELRPLAAAASHTITRALDGLVNRKAVTDVRNVVYHALQGLSGMTRSFLEWKTRLQQGSQVEEMAQEGEKESVAKHIRVAVDTLRRHVAVAVVARADQLE